MPVNNAIRLPVRLASGLPLRLKEPGDLDGGWGVVTCSNLGEALQIMSDFPAAQMPCWRNPEAVWNKKAAEVST
jgi:hypothetical protein